MIIEDCAHLWRVEVQGALDAGAHTGQYNSNVSLESFCPTVDQGYHSRLIQFAIFIGEQGHQHTVDPPSRDDRI